MLIQVIFNPAVVDKHTGPYAVAVVKTDLSLRNAEYAIQEAWKEFRAQYPNSDKFEQYLTSRDDFSYPDRPDVDVHVKD